MKKFIAILILSLSAMSLWADTSTTGNMKLLKPSTSTVDKNRSWGDKLNTNFDIIDATMTNNMTQITTLLTATAPVITSFNNFTSTTQAQIFTLLTATAALLNSTNTFTGSNSFSSATFISSVSINGSLQVSSSFTLVGTSMTIGGNSYIWTSSAPESGNNVLQRTGTRLIWGGDSSGGGAAAAATGNSTNTYTLSSDFSIYNSTTDITAVAYDRVGISSINVTGVQAFFMNASTQASSWIVVNISTGGANSANAATFPRVEIPTATGSGYQSYSTFYSTAFQIRTGDIYGVMVTTSPSSGKLPRGLRYKIRGWESPFVAP